MGYSGNISGVNDSYIGEFTVPQLGEVSIRDIAKVLEADVNKFIPMWRSFNSRRKNNPDPVSERLAELEQEINQQYRNMYTNNDSHSRYRFIKPFAATLLLGIPLGIGLIWLVNLPYPMIRRPIARTAPLLLLPSYIKMDRDYREAIKYTEQSDQLINQATSSADINLGAEKVQLAQEALDGLPVWFLGYQPQFYCRWFSCQWRFTFDEFQRARKDVSRLEAKIFQEQNAQTQLTQAEQQLTTAKAQYQTAADPGTKQQAIASWQTAMDQLSQVPDQTIAGELADQKLSISERDFNTLTGGISQRQSGDNQIAAAGQFAMKAAQASQNPPHSALQWQQVAKLWEEAVKRLQTVSSDNPSYLLAQEKLAEYQTNLGIAEMRMELETQSEKALQKAKDGIAEYQKIVGGSDRNQSRAQSQLRQIINQLEQVKSGTTSYSEAQQILKFARQRQSS
ncbi:MAG: hypothetical protein ACFBSC_14365 [Microcoleaceae cyanobacterium]